MTELNTNAQIYASQLNAHGSNDEIDITRLLGELIDKKWLIIFTTLAFGLFGIIYGQFAVPIFKSNAFIQVEDNSGAVLALDGLRDLFSGESSAETEIYIIKSRTILGKTVDDLNLTLHIEPEYFPLIGHTIARLHNGPELAKPIFGDSYAWGGERVIVSDFTVPTNSSARQFLIVAEGGQEFSLWFKDEKLLSGVAGTYTSNLNYGIKIEEFNANKGTRFTLTKVSRLDAVLRLQNQFKAVSLGQDAAVMELSLLGRDKEKIAATLNSISNNYVTQNVQRLAAQAENSLSFINGQIPKVQASLNLAEMALNSYRAARDSVNLSLETQSLLESLVKLEGDISAMALNEADISRRYTKQHPNYVSFKRQQLELTLQRERLNSKISFLPETQQKILTLMRDFEVNQAIYLSLMNKSQELAIVKASTVGNVRVLDSAEVFPKANSPKKGIIFAVWVFLGGILSVLFVLIRSVFNTGVSNAHEFQAVGLNVYATIPVSMIQTNFDLMKESLKKRRSEYLGPELLLSDDYPTDVSVEAIRSLRTSLHFGMVEAKNNIIMITSGSAAVGKSFVTSNFCTVLAQSGQRVLLVDADLRRGYLHKRFSFDVGSGLSGFLQSSLSIADVAKTTKIDGLDLVSRGAVTPNPSELLMSDRFKQFMDEASNAYDLVVIDTPPILAVTDAAVIGQFVGTSMMVARFEKSTLGEVEAANERFRLNGIDIKGLIFNAIEPKASNYYGGYSYYNYSYESHSSKD